MSKNIITRLHPDIQALYVSGRGSLLEEIIKLYGDNIFRTTLRFANLREKRARNLSHIAFSQRCMEKDLTRFLRTSFALLRQRIKHIRYVLHKIELLLDLDLKLARELRSSMWLLDKISPEREEKKGMASCITEIKKFEALMKTKYPEPDSST